MLAFTGGLTLSCCRCANIINVKSAKKLDIFTFCKIFTPIFTPLHRKVIHCTSFYVSQMYNPHITEDEMDLRYAKMQDDCVVKSDLVFVRYDK